MLNSSDLLSKQQKDTLFYTLMYLAATLPPVS